MVACCMACCLAALPRPGLGLGGGRGGAAVTTVGPVERVRGEVGLAEGQTVCGAGGWVGGGMSACACAAQVRQGNEGRLVRWGDAGWRAWWGGRDEGAGWGAGRGARRCGAESGWCWVGVCGGGVGSVERGGDGAEGGTEGACGEGSGMGRARECWAAWVRAGRFGSGRGMGMQKHDAARGMWWPTRR